MVFDRGPIVSGIASYPTFMTFFSTAEQIAIGGVPFIVATEKPTRRDALAYYRGVASHYELDVRQFETVERLCVSLPDGAEAASRALAGGDTHADRRRAACALHVRWWWRPGTSVARTGCGVPGESLPHVRHGYTDGHEAWQRVRRDRGRRQLGRGRGAGHVPLRVAA